MKKGMSRSNKKKVIIGTAIIILIVAGIYFSSAEKECNNYNCFKDSLKKCERSTFINEKSEATFLYRVTGSSQGKCEVLVKFLQANKGEPEIKTLVGREMTCTVRKGYDQYPEKNLANCTGLLKEGLQDITINKLYNYLLQNLNPSNNSSN